MDLKKIIQRSLQSKKEVFIIYTILTFLFYFRIFQTYFQSDEWHFFQVFLPYTHSWLGVLQSGIDIVIHPEKFTIPHATPLSIIFWTTSMKLFGLHVTPHFILSLAIHILNSYLLYIFTFKLTKNYLISFIAGLFFTISANQYQSVVWIGTYLITSTAATFTLLSFISLLDHLEKQTSVWKVALFTIAALLTKESTLLIIPAGLTLIFMYSKKPQKIQNILPYLFKLIQTRSIQFFIILTVIYLPIRILVVALFNNKLVHAPTLSAADPAFAPFLVLFRLVTYPLKMLVELFLPYPLVPAVVEFLTPLAYPAYGAEKAVRGTNFLLFTQSAGIDLLIYPLATMFVTVLIVLCAKKYDPYKQVLVFAITIIIFASWPLIMVASFAPAAAYVSFFDSRHMYLPAVGGSLLFAYLVHAVFAYLQSKNTFFIPQPILKRIGICILLCWSGAQFFFLQSLMQKYVENGRDRRELTSVIMKEVKKKGKSGIFYIKSDSVYYGYGDLMPPFETNFGQVLTVYLNQQKLLPDSFLDTSYLLSKGLNGQGVKKQNGAVFGYFINTTKVIEALEKHRLSPQDVYAFEWKGKEHSTFVISDEVRHQLAEKIKERARYASWKTHKMPELTFRMKTPPDSKLTQLNTTDPNTQKAYRLQTIDKTYEIYFKKRIFHVGIYEDVSLMQNADGALIGEDFYYRTINMKDNTSTLAKIPTKGEHLIYFLPALLPETIIQIDVPDSSPLDTNTAEEELEEIISLISIGAD